MPFAIVIFFMKTREELHRDIITFLDSAKKPLLVVMGPTASGKSRLAVELAQQFDGEVINADSRQIYEDMAIGNERTKPEEMKGIVHHLFASYPVSHPVSLAEYKREAERIIEKIQTEEKVPILCGGTLLWIDAVVDNFQIPAGDPNPELRRELEKEGVEILLSRLEEVDPESAELLKECGNKRYIIRALEIYEQTGQPKSLLAGRGKRKYEVFKIAPLVDRDEVYERINQRTAWQLENGMIEEVEAMIERYAQGKPRQLLQYNWPGLSSIGCKELIPYLLGKIDKRELLSQLQQNNRRYAKRQLTWLRKDEEISWLSEQSETEG